VAFSRRRSANGSGECGSASANAFGVLSLAPHAGDRRYGNRDGLPLIGIVKKTGEGFEVVAALSKDVLQFVLREISASKNFLEASQRLDAGNVHRCPCPHGETDPIRLDAYDAVTAPKCAHSITRWPPSSPGAEAISAGQTAAWSYRPRWSGLR